MFSTRNVEDILESQKFSTVSDESQGGHDLPKSCLADQMEEKVCSVSSLLPAESPLPLLHSCSSLESQESEGHVSTREKHPGTEPASLSSNRKLPKEIMLDLSKRLSLWVPGKKNART